MSVGLSDMPKPGRSGAMQRKPASRTGGMTLRHRNDHVGSPCMNQTGGPSPESSYAILRPSMSANSVMAATLSVLVLSGCGGGAPHASPPLKQRPARVAVVVLENHGPDAVLEHGWLARQAGGRAVNAF